MNQLSQLSFNKDDDITLVCTNNRKEEYKSSQLSNVKDVVSFEGSHYLHWTNEQDILDLI